MQGRYDDPFHGSSENSRLVGGMGSDEGTDESSPLNSYNQHGSSAHSGFSSSSGFRKTSPNGSSAGMAGLSLSEKLDPRSRSTAQAMAVPKGAGISPYALPPQPNPTWMQGNEIDDWLHDPKDADKHGSAFSNGFPLRGVLNIGLLVVLALGLMALFAAYPIIAALSRSEDTKGGSNLGGTNSSGQIAQLPDLTSLIDSETPPDAQSRTGFDGKKYKLVFSDEFNTDGRSFYPGDDPYWEAVDLWYWGTQNYEWYDPAAVTTSGGALQITLSESPEHQKNFRGGMLQSWNKFCFSGGYLEASIRLPGYSDVAGLWPAFWMMGNLGRAGYGASLEGTWPYSYETCDVGTIWNQTNTDGTPKSNAKGGFTAFNGQYHTSALSWLQGQKLSACTCDGEDHPGPKVNGRFKGRAAPEIDVFEGQVGTSYADGKTKVIQMSQSLQSAPFNNLYTFSNSSGPAITVYDPADSQVNSYKGAAFQQATSVVTDGVPEATEYGALNGDVQGGQFATYGTEFEGGVGKTATWVTNNKKAWSLTDQALVADPIAQIGPRVMAAEPMYIIFNLGISQSFGTPDFNHLKFPSTMSVDWVRVYQPEDNINIGCDPPDYPTNDYIQRHIEAYTNPQLQFWGGTPETGGYGQDWPRNSYLKNGCSAQRSRGGVENPQDPHIKAPYVSQSDLPPY